MNKKPKLLIIVRASTFVQRIPDIVKSINACMKPDKARIHILVDCNRTCISDFPHEWYNKCKQDYKGVPFIVTFTHSNIEWYGYNMCNEAICHPENVDCEYAYLLDDDTNLALNFDEVYSEMLQYPNMNIYIFNQARLNKETNEVEIIKPHMPVTSHNVYQHLDAGQFIIKKQLIIDTGGYVYHYAGDGLTLRRVLQYIEDKISTTVRCIDITASKYNWFTELRHVYKNG